MNNESYNIILFCLDECFKNAQQTETKIKVLNAKKWFISYMAKANNKQEQAA